LNFDYAYIISVFIVESIAILPFGSGTKNTVQFYLNTYKNNKDVKNRDSSIALTSDSEPRLLQNQNLLLTLFRRI